MDLSGIKVVAIAVVLLVAGIGAGFGIGFGIYQPKISDLEGQNSQMQGQISSLQNQSSQLQSQISDFEGNVSDLQSQLEEANTLRAQLLNQISNLTSQNVNLTNQITDLQSQLQEAEASIAELQAYITELEERGAVTWNEIVKRGYIRVASSPDWPPYEYLNLTGEIVGFEVELMEIIADRLSLTVEWVEMSFDCIFPAVQSMEIDLGVSGFSVTPERLVVAQFTMPHSITEGQVIMLESRANDLGITELESLANLTDLGLTCGTQVDTTQQDELSEVAPSALRTYEDFLLALDDMKRGAIDCVYAETPLTSWWILEAEQKGEEPIVVIYRRSYWPVAFVAHHDASLLVEKINGALAEIIAEGELDELKAKWRC